MSYDPKLQPGLGFYCVMFVFIAIPCWYWYGALVIPTFFAPYDAELGNTMFVELIWAGLFLPVFLAPFICPLIGIWGSKTMSKFGL